MIEDSESQTGFSKRKIKNFPFRKKKKKIFKEQVINTMIQCNVKSYQDSIYNLDEHIANLGIETLRLKEINIQL